MQHFSDHVALFKRCVGRTNSLKNPRGKQQVSFHLLARALRDAKELNVVAGAFATVALSNIRRNRCRRAPNLSSKAKQSVTWKLFRMSVG